MSQRLSRNGLHRRTISSDFAHEHGALYGGDAKIGHRRCIGLFREASSAFLFHEEHCQLVLDDLEDQHQVLADQIVIFGDLIADRPKQTPSRHVESLLQFQLRQEPVLQVFPGIQFIIERSVAALNSIQIALEDLVNEVLFILEVMVELPFSGARALNDLVWTGGADSLLVEKVRRSLEYAKPGLFSPL